jgi:hypothetical protein
VEEPARGGERPPSHRIAALVALLALVAAGLLSAWWIVTDRIELPTDAARPEAAARPTPSP